MFKEERESWKDIEGFEGLYQVSNMGRVRSLDREDAQGSRRKGRVLADKHNNRGYHTIDLCRNLFKPVDEPVKASPIVVDVDAKPILDRLKEIKAEMSTKIKGVTLSDDLKFSEPFIAELDKALNDYHQKQERYRGRI